MGFLHVKMTPQLARIESPSAPLSIPVLKLDRWRRLGSQRSEALDAMAKHVKCRCFKTCAGNLLDSGWGGFRVGGGGWYCGTLNPD